MKETFGQKTRRSHKRNQRVVMFWCAFVFAFVIGVIGEELPLTKSIMEGVLKEGRPIICSMRPGDFTTTGHFIVITGIKDGQFTVNDPNSTERSNMLWDYDTLKPQISNLWAFQAL